MKKSHPVSCFTWPITPGLIPEPLLEVALPENRRVRVYCGPTVFMAFRTFQGRKTARNRPPADHTGKAGRGPARENKRERSGLHSRDSRQHTGQQGSWCCQEHREDVPEKNRVYQHNRKEGSKS